MAARGRTKILGLCWGLLVAAPAPLALAQAPTWQRPPTQQAPATSPAPPPAQPPQPAPSSPEQSGPAQAPAPATTAPAQVPAWRTPPQTGIGGPRRNVPRPRALPPGSPVQPQPQSQAVLAPPQQPAEVPSPVPFNPNAAVEPRLRPGQLFAGPNLEARIDAVLTAVRYTNCAARLKQIVVALSEGYPANFVVEPMSVLPNLNTLVTTVETQDAFGNPRFSVIHLAPNCSGTYTQTIVWRSSCPVVASGIFPNFRPEGLIGRAVASYRAAPNLQLSLIPTGEGCTSIKKEMFM